MHAGSWFPCVMLKNAEGPATIYALLLTGTVSTTGDVRTRDQAADAAERRETYPAGRILHLVPSRFVFPGSFTGADAAAGAAGTATPAQAAPADGRVHNGKLAAHRSAHGHWPDGASDDQSDGSSECASYDSSELSGSEEALWEEMDALGASDDERGCTESPGGQAVSDAQGWQPVDVEASGASDAADPVAAAVALVRVRLGIYPELGCPAAHCRIAVRPDICVSQEMAVRLLHGSMPI